MSYIDRTCVVYRSTICEAGHNGHNSTRDIITHSSGLLQHSYCCINVVCFTTHWLGPHYSTSVVLILVSGDNEQGYLPLLTIIITIRLLMFLTTMHALHFFTIQLLINVKLRYGMNVCMCSEVNIILYFG